MIPKPKRIKDTKLKDRIRKRDYNRCQICGDRPSQTHHIKTVGSGGDDVSENLVRLCEYGCHRKLDEGRISQDYLRELALIRIREEGE